MDEIVISFILFFFTKGVTMDWKKKFSSDATMLEEGYVGWDGGFVRKQKVLLVKE
jgi:hypothetical protein